LELESDIGGLHVAPRRIDRQRNKSELLSRRCHKFATAVEVSVRTIEGYVELELIFFRIIHGAFPTGFGIQMT
jgi:hypothetical protein